MIELQGLVKEYAGHAAVCNVSFVVRAGEATGYLGPNGAGKSTTVKILAGLVKPTAGSVRIGGIDLLDTPLEAKRKLGYVPETAALYTTLTPHEYLSMVAELYHIERRAAAERIDMFLRAFQIEKNASQPIESLSKGMRQKVLLTSALLHDPEVLLLDEPLNGLDVNAVATFKRILENLLARGRTVLFCSHILEVVERVCSRVIVLNKGEVVADDTTANLLAHVPQGTLENVFRSLTQPNQPIVGDS